jgi:hypothetical protein
MKEKLAIIAACILFIAHPAFSKEKQNEKDAPSRAPVKGCKWEKLSAASLELDAWVQRCDFGFRKIDLFVQGNSVMIRYSDGGAPEPLIDVIDLKDDETPEVGIKRIFAERTTDKKLVAQCVLKPYTENKPPRGVKWYTFNPTAALQKQIDATTDPGDVPEPPCGDWGYAPDSVQYFEAQPSSGARKVLFVRAGQDEPLFDEKTLHLLPPSQL